MDLTQLLLRLFVKDYRNTEDPAVRTRYGKLAGIVGIVCNVLHPVSPFFRSSLFLKIISYHRSEELQGFCKKRYTFSTKFRIINR